MPDFLLAPGVAIYLAFAVSLTVWLGLFVFLWRIDQQTKALRQQLDDLPPEKTPEPRATLIEQRGKRKEERGQAT